MFLPKGRSRSKKRTDRVHHFTPRRSVASRGFVTAWPPPPPSRPGASSSAPQETLGLAAQTPLSPRPPQCSPHSAWRGGLACPASVPQRSVFGGGPRRGSVVGASWLFPGGRRPSGGRTHFRRAVHRRTDRHSGSFRLSASVSDVAVNTHAHGWFGAVFGSPGTGPGVGPRSHAVLAYLTPVARGAASHAGDTAVPRRRWLRVRRRQTLASSCRFCLRVTAVPVGVVRQLTWFPGD